jgi:GTPase
MNASLAIAMCILLEDIMFIDRITIKCFAGKGGNGAIAWRREKYIPKGGPFGGNGGKGGSVILQADHNVYSLDWFHFKRLIRAKNGGAGGTNCKIGKNGEDLILKVPCGTLVKDTKTDEVLFDFVDNGQTFILCKGGRGGKGNHSFRSPTNQAPNIATPGVEGEEKEVELELKLIADIGLVGFPNAGKSTLLSRLTFARVKIAAYPFTTLQPNLGYLNLGEGKKILLADIPGIIEGAHKNRGLGFEFLRHIERTKALIYVVEASTYAEKSPIDDFNTLHNELKAYDPKLIKRPFVIALNKCDLEGAETSIEEFKSHFSKYKKNIHVISAEHGDGLKELKSAIDAMLLVDN